MNDQAKAAEKVEGTTPPEVGPTAPPTPKAPEAPKAAETEGAGAAPPAEKIPPLSKAPEVPENEEEDEEPTKTWVQRNILPFIRPIITLALTFAFIYLITKPLFPLLEQIKASIALKSGAGAPAISPEDIWKPLNNYLDKILPILMGVYGPILGFWFGERTALKRPGKDT